ncbi:MAG TPA: proline racemase family protein [Casimicrobiaceae bacterium]|nr:proline racemase family protein [Casimicrobiaceae bacterium]
MENIRIIDSHTAGEPTRVVVDGGPDLGGGSLAERRDRFKARFDHYRSGIVNEPRGSEVIVGALLCEPVDRTCAAGVIFFNNVGYLGMCGHGTIGLAVTLAHLGRLQPGDHRIETPVGVVSVRLHDRHRVTVGNVPSYRLAEGVSLDVPGYGKVSGDIAWGGNWFLLVESPGIDMSAANVEQLTVFARAVRRVLDASDIRAASGAEIDHVEVYAPLPDGVQGSRNFVLCPGDAYDRSPCGTGTSAKLACLHARGELRPGETWRQESIIGTAFEGSFAIDDTDATRVLPRITGSAYVTADATLLFDDDDPLRWGIDAMR